MVLSNYYIGWAEEFSRYPGMKLEYPPLDILWKVAQYSGMAERYPHFFAKSGYPAYFIYSLDKPWVYDIFRNAVVDNVLDVCGVYRAEGEPETVEQLLNFLFTVINEGRLVWMSWYQPVLVYGIEGTSKNVCVHWYHPIFAPQGIIWNLKELMNWWEWADFQGARLVIAPGRVEPQDNEIEIAIKLAEFVASNMRNPYLEMNGEKIPMGLSAYDKYVEDLNDKNIDFLAVDDEGRKWRVGWFSFAIYSQWTQNFALHCFFSRASDFFQKEQKRLLNEIADAFGQVYGHWLNWEKQVGRHQNVKTFESRIGDLSRRQVSAECVLQAKGTLLKALSLIDEFVGSVGEKGEIAVKSKNG